MRKLNYDAMRIFAILFVILLHVSANGVANPMDDKFFTYNIFSMISRCCVPLFFMISGYLNLSRDFTIRIAIKKSLHIFLILIFWSFVYTLNTYLTYGSQGLLNTVQSLVLGNYHLWFMYAIIGLYLLSPIIKKFLDDKSLIEYFLILGFIFSILPSTITIVMRERFLKTLSLSFIKGFYVRSFGGFIIYYVLGYYLGKYEIKYKNAVKVLGIISLIFSTVMQYRINEGKEALIYGYYDNLGLFIYLYSMSVFLIFKDMKIKSNYVYLLSSLTFGIYLIHDLILKHIGKYIVLESNSLEIILKTLVVFVVSGLIAYIFKKIKPLYRLIS